MFNFENKDKNDKVKMQYDTTSRHAAMAADLPKTV